MSGYPHCPHCPDGCTVHHLHRCGPCGQSHGDYGRRATVPAQRRTPAENAYARGETRSKKSGASKADTR